jgi:hypothetical protein
MRRHSNGQIRGIIFSKEILSDAIRIEKGQKYSFGIKVAI